MNNDVTSREYLSLYRQHFNMMQSFLDLNNNIIVGINNSLSLQNRRSRNVVNRPFSSNLSFSRPMNPPPPPPPPLPTPNIFQRTTDISRNTSRTTDTRNTPFSNRRTFPNSTFFNSPITRPPTRRSHRRSFNTPFFFNTTFNSRNLQDTLNNSLYDTYPQRPLTEENFNNETISNTWGNIRNIYDLSNNQICPITRENFEDDTNVARINHCGHIFTRSQLLNWFQFDTRCPICRYNLANPVNETTPTTPTTNTTPTTTPSTNTTPTTPSTNTTPSQSMSDLNEEINRISSIINNNQALNDISENIYNLSNEIASNVMNVFSDISQTLNNPDNSNNTLSSELIFNIPNLFNNIQNSTTFPETNYNTAYNPFTEQTILNPTSNNENNQNTNNTENEQNLIDEENPTDSTFDDTELYSDEDNVD